jgi:hypothetical protein
MQRMLLNRITCLLLPSDRSCQAERSGAFIFQKLRSGKAKGKFLTAMSQG